MTKSLDLPISPPTYLSYYGIPRFFTPVIKPSNIKRFLFDHCTRLVLWDVLFYNPIAKATDPLILMDDSVRIFTILRICRPFLIIETWGLTNFFSIWMCRPTTRLQSKTLIRMNNPRNLIERRQSKNVIEKSLIQSEECWEGFRSFVHLLKQFQHDLGFTRYGPCA